jgi:DUF1365 family protein
LVTPQPGLYVGTLRHRRFGERPHQFTSRIFMPLLDIDRLAEAMRVSRLTGYNRWNWATFDERDHFGNPSRTLRERLRESARGEGVELSEGPIFLLTHLRYAGYVFNPISIFYCYEPDGRLAHVLAEVNNTYGGRHLYWLTDAGGRATNSFRARVEKSLYVSPFIDVDVNYEFVLTPPGDSLVAHMNVLQTNACGRSDRMLDATLSLTYRPWTATEIRSALMRFPLMTTKVIAAIHWQALRLYLKGVPVVPRLVANGEGERRAQADARHQPLIVEPAKESR